MCSSIALENSEFFGSNVLRVEQTFLDKIASYVNTIATEEEGLSFVGSSFRIEDYYFFRKFALLSLFATIIVVILWRQGVHSHRHR
jgi:hypothetical protein